MPTDTASNGRLFHCLVVLKKKDCCCWLVIVNNTLPWLPKQIIGQYQQFTQNSGHIVGHSGSHIHLVYVIRVLNADEVIRVWLTQY